MFVWIWIMRIILIFNWILNEKSYIDRVISKFNGNERMFRCWNEISGIRS